MISCSGADIFGDLSVGSVAIATAGGCRSRLESRDEVAALANGPPVGWWLLLADEAEAAADSGLKGTEFGTADDEYADDALVVAIDEAIDADNGLTPAAAAELAAASSLPVVAAAGSRVAMLIEGEEAAALGLSRIFGGSTSSFLRLFSCVQMRKVNYLSSR